MQFKKSLLSLALATSFSVSTAEAAVIKMDYSGLLVLLNSSGAPNQNTSYPYYGDPTWGYGLRTPISGSIQYDTSAGLGTATISPFEYFGSGPFLFHDFELKAIGDGAGGSGSLIIGNVLHDAMGNNNVSSEIVLDASGLFAEIPTMTVGDVFDSSTCAISNACALPASNGMLSGKFPIGLVPIATTTLDTDGVSITGDDGVGGSPFDNGPFPGHSFNFDFTSITVTEISAVPLPASAWLLGSGVIGLLSVSRKKRLNQ